MAHSPLGEFFSDCVGRFAIVLGTSEIASAVAVELTMEGFRVVMSHDPFPPVIRRGMAFHDALFDDHAEVEGVIGRRAHTVIEVVEAMAHPRSVAVTHLQLSDLLTLRAPDVLIDARVQKLGLVPNLRKISRVSIGLGPHFVAGLNCDVAVETHPSDAGRLVEQGATLADDHSPRFLGGVGRERFIYSARGGIWRTPLDIGAHVFKGFVIGRLDGFPVVSPMDGFLRGVARDGSRTPMSVKIVEVDPRGRDSSWEGRDERGRAIAEATIRAIALAAQGQKSLPPAVTLH